MIKLDNAHQDLRDRAGHDARRRPRQLGGADGEVCVLLGPSGCGKTTTLKMINRLIQPTSGKIFIDGKDTDELRRGRAAPHHRLRHPADRPLSRT